MRFTKPHTGGGGLSLPDLNNPAGENQIAAGYEAIDENGNILTGVHECEGGVTLPELDNPAKPDDILKGSEAIDENGNKIIGTHVCETLADMTADGNAGPEDIAEGMTAYVDGVKITGVHVCETLADMTFDATAGPDDILKGETAYVNGEKITGTHECKCETMEVDDDMIDLTGYTFVDNIGCDSTDNIYKRLNAGTEYLLIASCGNIGQSSTEKGVSALLEMGTATENDDDELIFKVKNLVYVPWNRIIAVKVNNIAAVRVREVTEIDSDKCSFSSVAIYEKNA
ncbi:MAG: hypothetical protein IJW78_04775 [Clostridia bacterium]|nr:hypothetical protein [Clostridia bacterium]